MLRMLIVLAIVAGSLWLFISNKRSLDHEVRQVESELSIDETIDIKPPVRKAKQPASTKMYKWVDDNGKVHFSDTAPEDASLANNEVDIEAVSTTKFKKTPRILPVMNLPARRRSGSQATSGKNEKCERLKREIARLEKAMDRGQRATSFAASSNRLKESRWEKIKAC